MLEDSHSDSDSDKQSETLEGDATFTDTDNEYRYACGHRHGYGYQGLSMTSTTATTTASNSLNKRKFVASAPAAVDVSDDTSDTSGRFDDADESDVMQLEPAPIPTAAEPATKARRSSSVSGRKVLRLSPTVGGQSSSSDFVELDEE